MKFFYSASTMNYGFGYRWHNKYNFPNFPRVTRTLTYNKKIGIPFAIFKCGNSVWNRVGLHNMGFWHWMLDYTFSRFDGVVYKLSNIIVSIAGYDWQIKNMIEYMEKTDLSVAGIELNFSCPNVKNFNNKEIPKTKYPLYLKLNCNQDPYEYDLNRIAGIRMNSVPGILGGWSGKAAQKKNWKFIENFNYEGLNIAGCSFRSLDDIKLLSDMGCVEFGIGSIIMTNPRFVDLLGELKGNERWL